MDADARRVWQRIEDWPLSMPERPLEFESRLADDCGWTLGHAIAVTREYRRFVMLTQVQSGGAPPRPVEPVAPSADVDAAWHQHITRTSDYERFCFEALGRFLHHHPSLGGVEELARHRQMYARTLDVYRDVFDAEPPPAIWPGVDERFAPARRREPAEAAARAGLDVRLLLLVAGFAVAGALAMACAVTGVLAPLRAIPGPVFALAYLAMLVGLALAGFATGGAREGGPPACGVEPYELAWLVGGVRRMTAVAVVSLVDAGRVRLVPATTPGRRPGRTATASARIVAETAFATDTSPPHPVERAVLEAATGQAVDFGGACHAAAPVAATFERRLQDAGWACDRGLLASRRLTVFTMALLLLAVVLERLAHAIEVQRAIGLLVLLLAVHVVLAAALLLQRGRLTARGRAWLAGLRRQVRRPVAGVPAPAAPATSGASASASGEWLALPVVVALFGAPAVMADPRFAGVEQAIGREGLSHRGGDSGGGSGCSGGGDGGSGGGCGGCGGS